MCTVFKVQNNESAQSSLTAKILGPVITKNKKLTSYPAVPLTLLIFNTRVRRKARYDQRISKFAVAVLLCAVKINHRTDTDTN